MVTRLKNIEGLNLQSLQRRIDNGYRFIVYQYSISLIFGNVHLASPAYLLKEDEFKKQGKIYTFISLIFGWWSIPDGPSNTLESIKTNIKGGVDVTKDILHNLTKDSLNLKKVKIEQVYTIFKSPQKSIVKNFIKSINKTEGLAKSQKIYLGRFINTNASSYFILFEKISELEISELLKHLREIYYEHVEIEILELNKEDEIHQRLIEQGIEITN